jgi:DNA replication protein DnaC
MLPNELPRDLEVALKQLRLGRLIPLLPERLRQARERKMDPSDALLMILTDEVQRRKQQRMANRIAKANLDPTKVFDEWSATANVAYNSRLLDQLRTLQFVNDKQHVLLMGPVGVGKTMLAQSLANLAVLRGMRVEYFGAEELLKTLKACRLDDSHTAEMRRLISLDLIVIDDLALRSFDVMETSDLYELITKRHRKGSLMITSNRTPDEWLPMLTDPMLAQALVDRFVNNAWELVIEGESYRRHQKPQLS